eukprot:gnl/Chilomastix_cuspidata/2538.p1 GENE.gnl/Chilomastix_cuspidata/2538~~gnl/Chilomastix_cuspidata/2538.p1  ORF type:complete len:1025 (+),score=347.51 gnl/Chilomastix_cuspidata/2538:334-3408(+)
MQRTYNHDLDSTHHFHNFIGHRIDSLVFTAPPHPTCKRLDVRVSKPLAFLMGRIIATDAIRTPDIFFTPGVEAEMRALRSALAEGSAPPAGCAPSAHSVAALLLELFAEIPESLIDPEFFLVFILLLQEAGAHVASLTILRQVEATRRGLCAHRFKDTNEYFEAFSAAFICGVSGMVFQRPGVTRREFDVFRKLLLSFALPPQSSCLSRLCFVSTLMEFAVALSFFQNENGLTTARFANLFGPLAFKAQPGKQTEMMIFQKRLNQRLKHRAAAAPPLPWTLRAGFFWPVRAHASDPRSPLDPPCAAAVPDTDPDGAGRFRYTSFLLWCMFHFIARNPMAHVASPFSNNLFRQIAVSLDALQLSPAERTALAAREDCGARRCAATGWDFHLFSTAVGPLIFPRVAFETQFFRHKFLPNRARLAQHVEALPPPTVRAIPRIRNTRSYRRCLGGAQPQEGRITFSYLLGAFQPIKDLYSLRENRRRSGVELRRIFLFSVLKSRTGLPAGGTSEADSSTFLSSESPPEGAEIIGRVINHLPHFAFPKFTPEQRAHRGRTAASESVPLSDLGHFMERARSSSEPISFATIRTYGSALSLQQYVRTLPQNALADAAVRDIMRTCRYHPTELIHKFRQISRADLYASANSVRRKFIEARADAHYATDEATRARQNQKCNGLLCQYHLLRLGVNTHAAVQIQAVVKGWLARNLIHSNFPQLASTLKKKRWILLHSKPPHEQYEAIPVRAELTRCQSTLKIPYLIVSKALPLGRADLRRCEEALEALLQPVYKQLSRSYQRFPEPGMGAAPMSLEERQLTILAKKKKLKAVLRKFDADFASAFGRKPTNEEKRVLAPMYREYKHIRHFTNSCEKQRFFNLKEDFLPVSPRTAPAPRTPRDAAPPDRRRAAKCKAPAPPPSRAAALPPDGSADDIKRTWQKLQQFASQVPALIARAERVSPAELPDLKHKIQVFLLAFRETFELHSTQVATLGVAAAPVADPESKRFISKSYGSLHTRYSTLRSRLSALAGDSP